MSWGIVVVLIVIGLILLLLEVIVIPGSTLVGILGFVSMAIGIWSAYSSFGSMAGHITLASTLVAAVIVLYFTLKSKTWNRLVLKDDIPHKVNTFEGHSLKPGDTGKAVSRLAPSGKAMFGDDFFEVHSMGDFVDHNTPIVVVKIEGYKIYVKRNDTSNG